MKEEKKRKKGFFLITLLMVLVSVLIFGGGTKLVVSALAKEIPKEIRIGDAVSYTGMYATFGINKFGVEAAVEDINKQGGIYVKEVGEKIARQMDNPRLRERRAKR